jgi:PKD repeat protein
MSVYWLKALKKILSNANYTVKMKTRILSLLTIVAASMTLANTSVAQQKKSAFFIGNSYTAYNTLPSLVANMASSVGDTLVWQMNTPGGATLRQHQNMPLSTNAIQQGTWDFIVLQEQSQIPAFPDMDVRMEFYPAVVKLDSMIKAANPCAKTAMYMTWGRESGDADNCPFFPPLCTYQGMDSLLRLRYMIAADSVNAEVAPVGAVWRYLRNNSSIKLYDHDQSHPSIYGSVAAAATFYTLIFRKSPVNISINNIGANDLNTILSAVKTVVFDSLQYWNIGVNDPKASFSYNTNQNNVQFNNTSLNGVSYSWSFGDGVTDTAKNPSHTYSVDGQYDVTLVVKKCNDVDTFKQTITIQTANGIDDLTVEETMVYPNPTSSTLTIHSKGQLKAYTITDVLGRTIVSGSLNAMEASIDVQGLQNGQYILEIQFEDQRISRHNFIKES